MPKYQNCHAEVPHPRSPKAELLKNRPRSQSHPRKLPDFAVAANTSSHTLHLPSGQPQEVRKPHKHSDAPHSLLP